jgi:small subunit ribosomal protein S20
MNLPATAQGGELATRSAAKAHRQSLKHRLRNRMVRSATRTTVKKAEVVIAAGDPEAAREAVRAALSYLDRAAKKGVIHANSAARRKSRLVLKYNAAVAAVQAPAAEAEAPKRRRATGGKAAAKPAKPAKATRAKKPKK